MTEFEKARDHHGRCVDALKAVLAAGFSGDSQVFRIIAAETDRAARAMFVLLQAEVV